MKEQFTKIMGKLWEKSLSFMLSKHAERCGFIGLKLPLVQYNMQDFN